VDTNLRNQILWTIIAIFIIWSLIFHVWNDSKTHSCNNCTAVFKSKMFLQDFSKEINLSVNEIYDAYLEGRCYVHWDRVNGYVSGGNIFDG